MLYLVRRNLMMTLCIVESLTLVFLSKGKPFKPRQYRYPHEYRLSLVVLLDLLPLWDSFSSGIGCCPCFPSRSVRTALI